MGDGFGEARFRKGFGNERCRVRFEITEIEDHQPLKNSMLGFENHPKSIRLRNVIVCLKYFLIL